MTSRAEEEAYQTLKAGQAIAQRLAYPTDAMEWPKDETSLNDLFRRTLRLSLARFERQFHPRKGAKQFGEFLEDFVVRYHRQGRWLDVRWPLKGA